MANVADGIQEGESSGAVQANQNADVEFGEGGGTVEESSAAEGGAGWVALPDIMHAEPRRCPGETDRPMSGIFDIDAKCCHATRQSATRLLVTKEKVRPFFKEETDFNAQWSRGRFLVKALRKGTYLERNWKRFHGLSNLPTRSGSPGSDIRKKFLMALYWASTGHRVQWQDLHFEANTGNNFPLFGIIQETPDSPLQADPEKKTPPKCRKRKVEKCGDCPAGRSADEPSDSVSPAPNPSLDRRFCPAVSSMTSPELDPKLLDCIDAAGYKWYKPGEVEALQAEVIKLREEVERLIDLDGVREENWRLRREIVTKKHLAESAVEEARAHMGFWCKSALEEPNRIIEGHPNVITFKDDHVLITAKDMTPFEESYERMSPAQKAQLPSGHDESCACCCEAIGICPSISNGSCPHRLHVHCFSRMWFRSGTCHLCFKAPVNPGAFYRYFKREIPLIPGQFYDFNSPSIGRNVGWSSHIIPDTGLFGTAVVRRDGEEQEWVWKEHVWRLIREFRREGGVTGWTNLPSRATRDHDRFRSMWDRHCADLIRSHSASHGLEALEAYISYINPHGETTGRYARRHHDLDKPVSPRQWAENANADMGGLIEDLAFRPIVEPIVTRHHRPARREGGNSSTAMSDRPARLEIIEIFDDDESDD